MSTPDVSARPLRADAERNRQRILAAAAVVYAERGLDVSLDEVAAAAGVGVGTVYRRFSDKDALIDALFEDKLKAIQVLAQEALEVDDPWEGFSAFLRGMCRLHASDRGLKEAMMRDSCGHDRVRRAREAITPLAGRVLRRAQDAGVVRADVTDTDMPLLVFAVGFIAERTREEAPEQWERLLTLALDGLVVQRDAPAEMPVAPLDDDAFARTMARNR
jgi:AcrR family transcriptional regulator